MGTRIETPFVQRNVFNLSHDRKFDCKMGQMIPILVEEVLPSDTWRLNTDMLVRLAPMVNPTYHEVDIVTRFFFVPNRLLWTDWEAFITGGPQGTSTPVAPTISFTDIQQHDLADYLGLPTDVATAFTASALPFRAIAKIYNDWFLDQTLQTPIALSLASGTDSTTSTALLQVNWEKDYFTSALPFTQRGNPVTIPLGLEAPITMQDQVSVGTVDSTPSFEPIMSTGSGGVTSSTTDPAQAIRLNAAEVEANMVVDLSAAEAPSVNDLRLAIQMQRVLEKLARSGGRLTEYNLAMFGVRSSDARLQRSEYLGGGKSQVVVSEVIQTSETNTTPQGTLAGHGFGAHRSHEFRKSFEEHGYIIGFVYILPRTAYCQGLHRSWKRTSRWDYYVPFLSHLGEQAILKREIYLDPSDGDDEEVFGYQGRGDEYRRRESSIHGNFRDPLGLGTWHFARIFDRRPLLTDTFVRSDDVATRPFALPSDPTLWVYLKNNVTAIRPLPKIAEPGFMDH